MVIETLTNIDAGVERAARDYIVSSPTVGGACIEHDPRWLDVLHRALGHEPIVLVARHDNGSSAWCGYLPLALVSSRLFGKFLVSLPYLNRAGVLANDEVTASALIDKAVEVAAARDVDYLELRHQAPIAHPLFNFERDEKVRMVLDLPDTGEALWDSYKAKVRNQIRKGDEFNLTIRWGGVEVLDDFYDVFAVNMRDLGTPVYSRRLFGEIVSAFGDVRCDMADVRCQKEGKDAAVTPATPSPTSHIEHHTSNIPASAELCAVYHDNRPIACALLVHDPGGEGVTQVPSASSLRTHSHTNANMWMYHQLLARAIERGSRKFDFGRSSVDSGTYRFKKQWGAAAHPTVWQYHVRRGDVSRMRPDNQKNQRRIAVWKRLPVWLTRMVGPGIVKGIP